MTCHAMCHVALDATGLVASISGRVCQSVSTTAVAGAGPNTRVNEDMWTVLEAADLAILHTLLKSWSCFSNLH